MYIGTDTHTQSDLSGGGATGSASLRTLGRIKIAIVFCLLWVLLVEMFAGVRGIGFLMGNLANQFQAAKLFATTIPISLFSIATVLGLEAINNRLRRWHG